MNDSGTITIPIDSKVSGYAYKRKERPTLFTGDMVWSIMTGRKNVTRRKLNFKAEVGDVLVVREKALYWINTKDNSISHVAAFAADGYKLEPGEKWTPSIHMPRKCCRLFLEVTAVREEPLQSITHEDAIREGVWFDSEQDGWIVGKEGWCYHPDDPIESFYMLWQSINEGGEYDWFKNPVIKPIEFKKLEDYK